MGFLGCSERDFTQLHCSNAGHPLDTAGGLYQFFTRYSRVASLLSKPVFSWVQAQHKIGSKYLLNYRQEKSPQAGPRIELLLGPLDMIQ